MKTNIFSRRFLSFIAFILAIVSAILLFSVGQGYIAKADDEPISILSQAEAAEKLSEPEDNDNLKGKFVLIPASVLSDTFCFGYAAFTYDSLDNVLSMRYGEFNYTYFPISIISYDNVEFAYFYFLSEDLGVDDSWYYYFLSSAESYSVLPLYVSDTSLLFDDYVSPSETIRPKNVTSENKGSSLFIGLFVSFCIVLGIAFSVSFIRKRGR